MFEDIERRHLFYAKYSENPGIGNESVLNPEPLKYLELEP